MGRRVAVTGLGAITPVGHEKDHLWESLCNGKSGISNITSFDTTGQDVLIAGEASDFDAVKWFRPLNKDDEFERGLVVGNLYDYDIDSMQRTLKSENLLLVKDYGDGVLYLLKLKRGED